MAERVAPLELPPDEFRRLGHDLVDRIAEFLGSLRERPLTFGETPAEIRALLGRAPLPPTGAAPAVLLPETARLLFDHSLFNGHPRFMGYITSSAAPLGALADLLAATVNPNVGGWELSPVASEIEAQTVRWVAELVGYPVDCGGLLVSGGNMANFVCFLSARRAKADWEIRSEGLQGHSPLMSLYASKETHTWIHKAADLFGLGTNAIRWIPTDDDLRMDLSTLRAKVREDREQGFRPFLVVGAGGTVSTGAVDPLPELAEYCRQEDLWFHVDGAYGAPAVASDRVSPDLAGLREADSVALDPHKWLYAPMEAGCALVRDPRHLVDAFSFHPEYYRFEGTDGEFRTNLFEHGMQNSRGFRALKVWVQLKQSGRNGLLEAIEGDMELAQEMARLLEKTPGCEVWTKNLSIVTFRYVPEDLRGKAEANQEYLNDLNEAMLDRIQQEGVIFISNAVIRGTFVLRACIVNFRTTSEDVAMVPGVVTALGRELDKQMRKEQTA